MTFLAIHDSIRHNVHKNTKKLLLYFIKQLMCNKKLT